MRDGVRLKAVAAASNNHRQVRELSNQAEDPTCLDRQRAAGTRLRGAERPVSRRFLRMGTEADSQPLSCANKEWAPSGSNRRPAD